MDAGRSDQAEVLDSDFEARTSERQAISIEITAPVVDEVEGWLDELAPELELFFGVSLTEREGAGFIRYPDGGFYGLHRDRANVPSWPDAARRRIAVVVFLNASFDGGVLKLLFDEQVIDVVPEAGVLVAFPADILHEVTPVAGGVRDAIVDWWYD